MALEAKPNFTQPEEQTKAEDTKERESGDDVAAPSPLEWAYLYRRIDDKPLSFARHKPLKALLEDDHPHQVWIKPAQIGGSEMAVTIACHALDVGAQYWRTGKSGINVGYIFSTEKALSNFSKERFSGLRLESEHLRNLFTDYNAVGFKQAGESYLYFAGGKKSTSSVKSFPADLLILDELDEMAPTLITLARKRLRASVIKREIDISTPTYPNKGIHAAYLQSDQQVWEIPCPKCGLWQELDFFQHVRANGELWDSWRYWTTEQLSAARMTVNCLACQSEMDRCSDGRWIARRPEIKLIRGRWLPALCFDSVSLNELAVNSVSILPEEVEEFYRSDLGLPYEPKGARVTDEMLKQLSSELMAGLLPALEWKNTTMGIDGGSRYHYRISSTGSDGKRYVRAMGWVASDDEKNVLQKCSDLIHQYKVRQVVIDGAFDMNSIQEWSHQHKGIVRRAFYPNTDMKGDLFRLPAAEEKQVHGVEVKKSDPKKIEDIVQINRTMAMDAVYNTIALLRERWPAHIHNDAEVVSHMKAPLRVLVKDKTSGQERATWIHTQRDDYFHACVYDLIAQLTIPKPVDKFVGVLPYTGGEED